MPLTYLMHGQGLGLSYGLSYTSAECVRQRNEVAIMLGIIFSLSFSLLSGLSAIISEGVVVGL